MCPQWIKIEVELGDGLFFEIVKEVDGFWISYDSEAFEGWKPSRSDLKWLVKQIKRVMKDLKISAPHFALSLVPFGGLGPNNPTCLVDKRREIIFLRLPIHVVDGELGVSSEVQENYIFYHELMHAKDELEGRFPSSGFINPEQNPELALVTSLWHFSIEGRLEKMGKPHQSRQETIETEYSWASGLEKSEMVEVEPEHWEKQVQPWPLKKLLTKEFFEKLCNKLWGKEVTFQELQSLLGIRRESSLKKKWSKILLFRLPTLLNIPYNPPANYLGHRPVAVLLNFFLEFLKKRHGDYGVDAVPFIANSRHLGDLS